MPATLSYASILYAVGQVLDQVGVKSIAIREEENGLLVEGLNSESSLSVQIHYTIADLYDLVGEGESLEADHTATATPSLLYQFLAKHSRDRELVGASV